MEDAFAEELAFQFRMGRLSAEDTRLFQSLFERWRLKRYQRPRFPQHRERRDLLMSHRHGVLKQIRSARGNGREAVFKVASTTSTREGTRNLIEYICRNMMNREEALLRDEYGNDLSRDNAVAALDDWPNYPNADREDTGEGKALSVRLNDPGNAVSGPAPERKTVLTYHLVFSMCLERDDPDDAEARFAHAVEKTLDDIFVDHAYPLLWALHDDCPGRPHAHVVLSAVSRHGERMRFDRAGDHVDYIRLHFARMLGYAGIEHSATRREDRQDELAAILSGEQKLRSVASIDDRSGRPAPVSARFPEWFELSGLTKEGNNVRFVDTEKDIPSDIAREAQRHSGSPGKRQGWFRRQRTPDKARRPATPPALKPLNDACAKVFCDPAAVIRKIRTIVDGDDDTRSFLEWRIVRRPEELGELHFPGYVTLDGLERFVRELQAVPADDLRREQQLENTPTMRFPHHTNHQRRDRREIMTSQMRVAAYWWHHERPDKSWDILNSLLDALGKDHRKRQERLGGWDVPGAEQIQRVFPEPATVSNEDEKPGRDYAREIVARAHPERDSRKGRKEATPPRKRKRRRGHEM